MNKRIEVDILSEKTSADIKVYSGPDSDFNIAESFYLKLDKNIFGHEEHFLNDCFIRDENGNEDVLSTIFYCVNSLQEYGAASDDPLERFQFKNSYQKKFNNVSENFVQQLIDKVCSRFFEKQTRRKSRIFLTHDIDSIHGAWKEDGFYAAKNLKFGKLFNVLLNEALGKPDWLNMDRIMKLENEFGFRSAFYWLLYKDKQNSDYNFKSEKIQKQLVNISSNGSENGLHKSLQSNLFSEELERLGVEANGNRFHYLDFRLPEGYAEIEKSGLKLDTSLGFFEEPGFRNNYGLPFLPYDILGERVFEFIEVPMQVMDRTFFTKRMNVKDVEKQLIDWFEKNKYDAVFSINFHNNFFSDLKYHGYTDLYKSLLTYFRENEFEPVTQTELIKEFCQPEKFKLN